MIRTIARKLIFLSLLFTLALSHPAQAQILDLAFGGTVRNDGGKVVGISLNSYGNTLTSLGFYDHNDDGIAASYQLGLWDSTQTLVRTATVTPASPLTDGFRYASIAPITIGTFAIPDTFTIGVILPPNPADVWLDSATLILYSGFTGAGTGQFSGPSGSLVYPSSFDSTPYYVVNANGPAPPLVPQPTALGLFAMIGLASWFQRRRCSRVVR